MEVNYIQHTGNDLAVVNAARVSFDKHSDDLTVGDVKLIKYLAEHKHISPFNHSFITLRVKAPLFVARQLQKHEYMPWNEVSRRYVDNEPEFYFPDQWRGKPVNVKQGSDGVVERVWFSDYGENYQEDPSFVYSAYLEGSKLLYNSLAKGGVAPEQARMVLPQSMYTEWYWSGTLAAWAKMYNLRIDPHSQKETQEIAKRCGEIIHPLFPTSWEALTNA